ncbi:MAG: hypothetical protein MJ252_00505 [archaeon]|nr:hypothetical protein [archaeon]
MNLARNNITAKYKIPAIFCPLDINKYKNMNKTIYKNDVLINKCCDNLNYLCLDEIDKIKKKENINKNDPKLAKGNHKKTKSSDSTDRKLKESKTQQKYFFYNPKPLFQARVLNFHKKKKNNQEGEEKNLSNTEDKTNSMEKIHKSNSSYDQSSISYIKSWDLRKVTLSIFGP